VANNCLTSRGVSFVGNSLYARPPDGDTVPFCLIKRLVMERSSVVEVLDTVQDLPFENLSHGMADAGGRMVCMEIVRGRRSITDVSGHAFGHANSVLSEELAHDEISPPVSPSSPVRQRNAQRLLDDQADPPGGTDPAPRTTAAYICDLTAGEIHIAIGNPCVAPFETYALSSLE